jgi:hypothetical protein
MQAEQLLLAPDAPAAALDRLLDSMPANAVFNVYYDWALVPDSAETAIRMWRLFTSKPDSKELYPPELQQVISVLILTYRGHSREAYDIIRANESLTSWPEFAALALAGAVPPDTADAVFRRRLHKEPFWPPAGLDYAPAWWAARRDSAALKLYVTGVRARFRAGLGSADPPAYLVRYRLGAAEAYLALVRGDTATALARLEALPATTGEVWPERLTLTRLLAVRGQVREALAVLDRGFPYPFPTLGWAPWALERARLAEQLGELEKARYWYGYAARVWRHADPELQPAVTEAREAFEAAHRGEGA